MQRKILMVLCLYMVPFFCLAEESPKPGPEVNQLSFYVGKWNETGESRSDPSGAFGKLSGHESCEWFSGGYSVVCRESTVDSNGTSDGLYILAYDVNKKLYTVYGTDNFGTIYSGTGTVENGTWRWTAEAVSGDSTTPMRYNFNSADAGARTMSVEVGDGNGSWSELLRVTYTPAH
jgi:hypothetical protein